MTTADKRRSVPEKEFLSKYIPMVKAGKSNAEIAEALGMEGTSCSVRASQIRKKYSIATEDRDESEGGQFILPKPVGSREKLDLLDFAESLIGTVEDSDETGDDAEE